MSKPDQLFRAFADQTRLRILHLLSDGEICVCDIMGVLQAPQPKVSRHLGYLKRAGLVVDRKQGLWRYYSLAPATGALHKSLVGCVNGCLEDFPALRRDDRKLRALKKKACC